MKVIEEHWQVYLRQRQPIIREEDYHRRREAFLAGALAGVSLMNLITQVAEIHTGVGDSGNCHQLDALLAELEELTETLEKP